MPLRLALSLALLLCCPPIIGCEKEAEKSAAPLKVAVAEVSKTKAAEEYTFSGTLAAKEKVEVRSKINGYLVERPFQEGAYVREGDLLYKLDDRDLKAALDTARAHTANLEAAYKNDAAIRDRYLPLAQKGAVSAQDRDNAIAKAAESLAAWKAAQADEEKAAVNLGYAAITAPIAGYVSRSSVDTGGYVAAGSALLTTLYRVDPIRAEFSITDKEFSAFRQVMAESGGDPQSLTFRLEVGDAHTPYGLAGVLEMADPVVDSSTNTLGVRAEFANPEHTLRPGLYVNVIASLGGREVLTVPEIAVFDQGAGKAVYVVDDKNTLVLAPVETARRLGENLIVLKGLTAGQKVVTEGLVTARPGLTVEITDK